MLLLVTILLVVVGGVSLFIGYTQSSLPPIYISIVCSVLAAGVLLIFSRMTRKSQKVDAPDEPTGLEFDGDEPPESDEPVPAMAGAGRAGRSSSAEAFAPETGQGSRYGTDLEHDDEDDDDFPIEGYDSRRVGEILPLLAELDIDELDVVREHEEQGKGRSTILARIDQLIDQLDSEDRDEAEHRFDADTDEDPGDEPVIEPGLSQPPPTVAVAALPDDDDYFPIEDYDDLRASQIIPLLPELEDDELEMVRGREVSGSARSSIVHRIDELLDVAADGPGPVPTSAFEPEPEPDPEPVVATVAPQPAKKTRAKKALSTTAAKAPAAKGRMTPAKVAKATKPVPARSGKPAKAPAKPAKLPTKPAKAVATKLPLKKAPAMPVKKAASPAKKTVKRAAKR
ncbi:MAG: hypothetical protein WKF86_04510 [Acidimicrobiales bacterium]